MIKSNEQESNNTPNRQGSSTKHPYNLDSVIRTSENALTLQIPKQKSRINTQTTLPQPVKKETKSQNNEEIVYEKLIRKIHGIEMESMKMQKKLMDQSGIEYNIQLHPESRIIKLAKMKEMGIKMKELNLSLEKRYEGILVSFNEVAEALKKYIISLLDNTKKELFGAIILEKAQTLANLMSLENRLHEAVYLANLPNKNLPANELTLKAFNRLFQFARDFKDDFLGLVCSKLKIENLKDLQVEVSKALNQVMDQPLIAPQAFPSELFRYLEQDKSNNNATFYRNSDTGNYIASSLQPPSTMYLEKSFNNNIDLPRDISSPTNINGKLDTRSFTLLAWAGPGELIASSNIQFRILSIDSSRNSNKGSNPDEDHPLCNLRHSIIFESNSEDMGKASIESIISVKYDFKTFILVGTSLSVLFCNLEYKNLSYGKE